MRTSVIQLTCLLALFSLLTQCSNARSAGQDRADLCGSFPVQVNDACFNALELDRKRHNRSGIAKAFSALESNTDNPSPELQGWVAVLTSSDPLDVPAPSRIPREWEAVSPETFLGWVSTGQPETLSLQNSNSTVLYRADTPIVDELLGRILVVETETAASHLLAVENELRMGALRKARIQIAQMEASPLRMEIQHSLVHPPDPAKSILREDMGIAQNSLAPLLGYLDETSSTWLSQWRLNGAIRQGLTGWGIEQLAPYCDATLRQTARRIRSRTETIHPLALRQDLEDSISIAMACYRAEALGEVLQAALEHAEKQSGLEGILLWFETARHWFAQPGSGEARALLTQSYLRATSPVPSEAESSSIAHVLRGGLNRFLQSTQSSSGEVVESLGNLSRTLRRMKPAEGDSWSPFIPALIAGVGALKASILAQAGEMYRSHQELDSSERHALASVLALGDANARPAQATLIAEGIALLRAYLDPDSLPGYPSSLLEPCANSPLRVLCGTLARASAFQSGSPGDWGNFVDLVEQNWLPAGPFTGLAPAIENAYQRAEIRTILSLPEPPSGAQGLDRLRTHWTPSTTYPEDSDWTRPFDGKWEPPSPDDAHISCSWIPSESFPMNHLTLQFTHQAWMEKGLDPAERMQLGGPPPVNGLPGWTCQAVPFWNPGRFLSSWVEESRKPSSTAPETARRAQHTVDTLALMVPGSSAMMHPTHRKSLLLSRESLPLEDLAEWTMELRLQGQLQIAQDLESLVRLLLDTRNTPLAQNRTSSGPIPWALTRAWYGTPSPQSSEQVSEQLKAISSAAHRAILKSIRHLQSGNRKKAAASARRAARGKNENHLLSLWSRLSALIERETPISGELGRSLLNEETWKDFPAERLGTAMLLIRALPPTDAQKSLATLLSPVLQSDLKQPESLQAINLVRQLFPLLAQSMAGEEIDELLQSVVQTGFGRLSPRDFFQWRVGALQRSMLREDARWTAEAFLPLVRDSLEERLNPPSFLRALRIWVLALLITENRASDADFATELKSLPDTPELRPVRAWGDEFLVTTTVEERYVAVSALGTTLFGIESEETPQSSEQPKADSTESSKTP